LLSLGWFRSRHPSNFLVSNSLGLNIYQNCRYGKVSVSTTFVSWVSQIHCHYVIWIICTILLPSDQSMHNSGTNDWFLLNAFDQATISHKLYEFSLSLGLSLDLETNILGISLGLVTETKRFKVSVLVMSLRLNDSKSWSYHRDFKIHGLGLDAETWIVVVSVSKLEYWSCYSLVCPPK
jgi:hypothetical protein